MEERKRPMETEVKSKKTRRNFTREYKLKIIQAYDSCTRSGEKGELLRREGLYSSTITAWRRQLLNGNHENKRLHAIEVENQRLKRELAVARKVIDVQKKS